MLKKVLIVFLLYTPILYSFQIYSQSKTDSLIRISGSNVHDTIRTQAFLDLSWAFKTSDTEIALKYGESALNLSRTTKRKDHEANALKNIGVIYLFSSNFPKAENYLKAAIQVYKNIGNKKGIAGCNNNLGLVEEQTGDYQQAFEYYAISLQINEEIDNKSGIASSESNIGNVLQIQGKYRNAIEYYLKSLKIREELNEKLGIADTYNNIGALYEKQNALSQAMTNYEKALMLYIEVDEKRKSGMVLHNLGYVQSLEKNYVKAMDYYEKSLEIRKECGDKQGIASTYMNIGELYYVKEKLNDAKKYYDSSYFLFDNTGNHYRALQAKMAIAKVLNEAGDHFKAISQIEPETQNGKLLPEDLKAAYFILSQAFYKTNDFYSAYHYQKKYIELKDSLNAEENTKNILRLQLDYEFQKKQKELELETEKQKIHDEKELSKRHMIILILVICLAAVMVIVVIIYRSYLLKREDNQILENQKKEIEEYNEKLLFYHEELLSQKEDLEVQKKMLDTQNTLLREKNQRINESIQYAKRIQTLLLPAETTFEKTFTDYFILYRPKDIVSGDFYWIRENNRYVILAVADCTGHGVPGAFMSVLNMSFLDEIVDSGVTNPAEILNQARDKIKKTLHNNINQNEPRDGMDIGICTIDKSNRILEFSGAYHSLMILNKPEENSDGLIEISGDKMPIGAHIKGDKPFKLNRHKIKKTDKFILYTDGFIDQFGGTLDRKFLPEQFKEIVKQTRNLKMKDQKLALVEKLEEWMDGREQIDDILVLGFQL